MDRTGRPVPSLPPAGGERRNNDVRRHEIIAADPGRVKDVLPTRGPSPADQRLVNAVLHAARTGTPWRDLPGPFGHRNSARRRFDRWAAQGVRDRAMAALRGTDLDALILTSTAARAHPIAAGATQGGRVSAPAPTPVSAASATRTGGR